MYVVMARVSDPGILIGSESGFRRKNSLILTGLLNGCSAIYAVMARVPDPDRIFWSEPDPVGSELTYSRER